MKKFLSGIFLLLSVLSFWSCDKKGKENALEMELTGSWNYNLEHFRLFDGQPVETMEIYSGTMIFHNDNTLEYKLDASNALDTKGTWKVVDKQVYIYFYRNFYYYNGSYDIVREAGKLSLHLIYNKNDRDAISVKFKLTK